MSEPLVVDGARVHFVAIEGGDWYCVGKGDVTTITLAVSDGIPWITVCGEAGPIATLNGLYTMRISYESVK